MTILTLLSFWEIHMRVELLLLPFFSFFNDIFPLILVLILGLQKKFASRIDQGSYIITSMPANVGTLAGLCAYLLYGEIAFAYDQLIVIVQNLVMLLVLFPMGYYYAHDDAHVGVFTFFKDNWRKVFINWNQLSLVGIAIGIVLSVNEVPRPPVLGEIFQYLIHISAWTALLPIGYLIDFSHFKEYCKDTLDLIPIKMIATPIASFFLALLFTDDPILLGTIVIVMASPCAINALVTLRLYNLNVNLSMAPFITTTLVYILVLYPAFYLAVHLGFLPMFTP